MTTKRLAALAFLASAALAACGGSATPAPSTPVATPIASPSPTAAVTPPATPTPVPAEFTSVAYAYGAVYPGTWRPTQATKPWDGEARIDATGPYTDQVRIPGNILFFVYGAPTDLPLDAYAAKTQAEMVAWHACPEVPAVTADLALDGTPGRLHQMTCLGLFVQKLMVVRDGEGLVVNMLAPPGTEDEADALFEELVAAMTWPA